MLAVILPFLSAVGLLLPLYNKVQFQFTGTTSAAFESFRSALQSLVAALASCYFPRLERVPAIPLVTFTSQDHLPLWKVVAAVCWFGAFEIALPVVDVVTTFSTPSSSSASRGTP